MQQIQTSREALKLKLAGGEKTATGKNSLKHTGDVTALHDDKDKVEEFFPEWTQHTGGALKTKIAGKKKVQTTNEEATSGNSQG